eukprot:1842146-Prymnesium_polylepis.2
MIADMSRQRRPPARSASSPHGAAAASTRKKVPDATSEKRTNCSSQHLRENSSCTAQCSSAASSWQTVR